jgi:hypothetical protein
MGTIVGAHALSGLRHFALFTLHLSERGSDQFTITHLSTSKELRRIQNQIAIISREYTFGGDVIARITSKLAGCGHSIGTKIEPYWKNPARNALMLHKRWSKSKGETPVYKSIRTAKAKGRLNTLAFLR